MSNCVVQFHDLVGLIGAKCAEITAAAEGGLSDKEKEVINYLQGVNTQLIIFCEEDPDCPSYVICPIP